MMNTQTAVKVIQEVEEDQYSPELLEAMFGTGLTRLSPSRALVHFCLNRWYQSRFRADNTTVLAVMLEDNQGVPLFRSDQNTPMSSLFSDSEEEEDSDDGYSEASDNNDYTFSQTYDCLRNNFSNNCNNINTNVHKIDDNSNSSTPTHCNQRQLSSSSALIYLKIYFLFCHSFKQFIGFFSSSKQPKNSEQFFQLFFSRIIFFFISTINREPIVIDQHKSHR